MTYGESLITCPYCKHQDSMIMVKKGILDYDMEEYATAYIVKCKKCDCYLFTVPTDSIKEYPKPIPDKILPG